MSFSSDVKRELCGIWPDRPCCRAAQLYGMLEGGRSFSREKITLQTEHRPVADLFERLLLDVTGAAAVIAESEGKFRSLSVSPADCRRIWERYGHDAASFAVRLNHANLECDECAAAYLRGAFLACGAMTTPQIGYHLEFRVPYYRLSLDWQALLADHGLASRRINRKGHYVLYFKESEQIEDCLTWMGAVGSSLELMNVKLVKNIRNNVNRIANCETANIDKVVAASSRQVAAVRRIADTCGIGALPEDLRELAALRLDNPEYSLRELSEELSTPLSRSGINHRLERIMAFAEKL